MKESILGLESLHLSPLFPVVPALCQGCIMGSYLPQVAVSYVGCAWDLYLSCWAHANNGSWLPVNTEYT